MKIKAALTASLGGAFEWYDFIIYGFFVQIFGDQFFPPNQTVSQNLLAFAVFSIGFFARPIGGLVFGHIGDVYGRSRSLYYSMILIGLATFFVAIMPTYSYAGVYSTMLFIVLRICQGFAIGGSISGSFIYISELSEPHTRSFWISTTFIGTMRGIILAALVSGFLISYLNHEQLHDWGWRIAFLLGSLILLMAHYTSHLMIETPYHTELISKELSLSSPIGTMFKTSKLAIIQAIGITAIHAVLTIFILLFMPTFLQYYGLDHKEALNVNIIAIMVFSTLLPLFGWFGNKASLRTLLFLACILLIIFISPILHMVANHDLIIRTCGILFLIILNCMASAAIPPIIVNLFPTEIRYCGVSFSYNLCIAVFAGFAPIVITLMAKHFNSIISAISILITTAAVISLISILLPIARYMPVANKRFKIRYH